VPAVHPEVFRTVYKIRVSEEIAGQVRDLILAGRLRPGDRLPAERELAGRLRVGRSALREALRVMESLGIIEVRPGRGTFVAGLSRVRRRDPLTASLYQAWRAQHDLFEIRRVLEPPLAALAANRATEEQIDHLRSILREQEAEVQRGRTGVDEDTNFHLLIAQASGNGVLVRVVNNLMDLLQKTREISLQRGGRPIQSLKRHRAILRAIEARRPAAAEQRMREHIREIEQLVLSVQGRPSGGHTPSSHSPHSPSRRLVA
jgi:GntR family transcriptional repressor for pyruvate dehydrogenase complex